MPRSWKIGALPVIAGLMLGMGSHCGAAVEGGGPGPCAPDIQKFCANVQPGGGAIAQCLKAHQADLSDTCKQRGEELKQKMQSFAAACQADSEKYCKETQPGGGRKIKCLKDNLANLSPDCKAQVSAIHTDGIRIQRSGTPAQTPASH